MKRNTINWMTILMVAIMSVGFMSCGGGDDDVKKESEAPLVGTWRLDFSTGYILLSFSQEGTVRYQEYDKGEWESDKVYHYTYNGNYLILTYYSESRKTERTETIEVISLSATELILKDWPDEGVNTFIKQ
jgi:hypothetical protein